MEDPSVLTMSQYHNFFDDLPPDKSFEYLMDKNKLQEYRMTITTQKQNWIRSYKLRLRNLSSKGRVVEYLATFGPFQMRLVVLHHDKESQFSREGKPFASGGFGKIYLRTLCSQDFVGKVVKYRSGKPNKKDIHEIIREVVICKLCSFLEIGPKVESKIPFDLICYTDCAQFHLERCVSLDDCTPMEKSHHKIQKDLKKCLKLLHKHHLVHRDIKPDNVLFVKRLNKFVLADFGLAQYVKQNVGQTTEVSCEGTFRYMVKGMKDIREGETGYVDLYRADVYALQKTLSDIKSRLYQSIPYFWSDSESLVTEKSQLCSSNIMSNIDDKEESFDKPLENESYEYYRILFAVTSLFDSEFNLQENWMYISSSKKEEILKLLVGSLSIGKVRRFAQEYMDMGLQNEPASVKKHIDTLRSKLKELKEPNFEPVSFTLSEIQLCGRTFGRVAELKAIKERLSENPQYDFRQVIAALSKQFKVQTKISYNDEQWQTILMPLSKYLSGRVVKAIYNVLSFSTSSFTFYILDDFIALAESDTIDMDSQKYLSYLNMCSEESCSWKPEEVEFDVKDLKRTAMIYYIMVQSIQKAVRNQRFSHWGQWLWRRLTEDNQGLEHEHANSLSVSLYLFKGSDLLKTIESPLTILEQCRIHNPALLLDLLCHKCMAYVRQKQYIHALRVLFSYDSAREHYFCLLDFQIYLQQSTLLRSCVTSKQCNSYIVRQSVLLSLQQQRLLERIDDCIRCHKWTDAEEFQNQFKELLASKPSILSDRQAKAMFLTSEAKILQNKSHYQQALRCMEEATAELTQLRDSSYKWQSLAECRSQSARICLAMKDYSRANLYLLKAQEMDQQTIQYPSARTLTILIGLSIGYSRIGEEELCRKYICRSEVVLKKGVKPTPGMHATFLQLQAEKCFIDKRYASVISKAKFLIKRALGKQFIGQKVDVPQLFQLIGICFQHLHNHAKAFTYFSKGLELSKVMLTTMEEAKYMSWIFLSNDPLQNKEYTEFIQCVCDILNVQTSKDSELGQKIIKILEKSSHSSAYTLSAARFISSVAKDSEQMQPLQRSARIRSKSVLVRILATKSDERLRMLAVLLALEVMLLYICSRETNNAKEYMEKASTIMASLTASNNEDIQEGDQLRRFLELQQTTLRNS